MNRTVNTLCYHINIKTDGLGNIVPAARYARSLVRALLQLSCPKENRSISQCLFKGVSGRSNRRLCDSLTTGESDAGASMCYVGQSHSNICLDMIDAAKAGTAAQEVHVIRRSAFWD